ncbi:MAG: signal peptide peptidase SppA [Bacteroidales bacterium]
MKSFFKYLLASILGVMIAGLLLFFIFIGIISAMVSSQDKPVDVKKNSVLLLKLNQSIHDRKPSMPLFFSDITSLSAETALGLNEILSCIDKARLDTNIRGIYLELSNIQAGIATVEEIRNALIDFKKSGKFIVAFSNAFSQKSYYLASVSDKLYLNPEGSLNFVGLSAELMFFKKTLEKLDIEPEVIRHGKFKSAVEPFMYDKMSPENREQIKTYVGSIWNHMVEQIGISRNIPVAKLNDFADSLLMWNNESSIRYGMINALLYKDQVLDTLANLVHISKAKDLSLITLQKYVKAPKSKSDKGYAREKIAVIYAEGDIVVGEQGEGYIGSEKIARTIRNARQDSSIKAIVFRVNSGGGSALASEVIWRELSLARQVKPVIASMGDVAASGGYYIVAAADTIVANPNTITGSIGVFGLLVNAEDFMENKLGVTTDVEKTNAYSDFGSIFRPLTGTERMVLQNMVDETYKTFVSHVSDGRKLPYESVDQIGEGRVWSGTNAQDRKLVDVMGGLNDAVDIAAKKAGLDNYRIVELPKQEDPFTQVMKELTGDVRERLIRKELSEFYPQYRAMKEMLSGDRIQAKLPFEVRIH